MQHNPGETWAFCHGCFAGDKAVVDIWKEHTVWVVCLFTLAVVLVLLATGTKHLNGMLNEEKAKEKQEVVPSSPEDLNNRLLQVFTEAEQDLVKLMTLVRSHKATIAMSHRGCKTSDCRQARESGRAFNLAVYDIVEE